MPKDKEKKDRVERIEAMERELKEIAGGEEFMFVSDDTTMEMKEKFLESVLAFENGEYTTVFEELEKCGFSLPAPDSLSDDQLSAKLSDLIQALFLLGVELHCTDHLSDRELYEDLFSDALREEAIIWPKNPAYTYHIDMIGSGSDEHSEIYYRYYADDETRRQFAEEWPDHFLPEKAPRPYDRDKKLPRKDLWPTV